LRPDASNLAAYYNLLEQQHPICFKRISKVVRLVAPFSVVLPSDLQPQTILIDEPELGLHLYAITVLASLLRSYASEKQVIISTQSADLVSEFEAQNLIVVNRKKGQSILSRLDVDQLERLEL
jgi:predicted ATPase